MPSSGRASQGAGPAYPPDSSTPRTRASGGTEKVRLASDRDLDAFVRRIVALSSNPRTRAQLVAGQLRFTLADGQAGGLAGGPAGVQAGVQAGGWTAAGTAPRGGGPAHRVERGAVTERTVVEAAERGQRLLLGRRAVLTPLARDRARTLGVPIEKER